MVNPGRMLTKLSFCVNLSGHRRERELGIIPTNHTSQSMDWWIQMYLKSNTTGITYVRRAWREGTIVLCDVTVYISNIITAVWTIMLITMLVSPEASQYTVWLGNKAMNWSPTTTWTPQIPICSTIYFYSLGTTWANNIALHDNLAVCLYTMAS